MVMDAWLNISRFHHTNIDAACLGKPESTAILLGDVCVGYFFFPTTASLQAFATLNFTTRLAGILIISPV